MSENVPVFPLFENPEKKEEYENLTKYFKQKFGYMPSFYVRVPGRVNLIGEHIDYCGYAVFPMAIEQDIVIAAALNNANVLNLTNIKQSYYQDFSTETDVLKIDQCLPQWYHYFMCGFRGVVEHYKLDTVPPQGLDTAVQGKIPPSAGLSSSSALVCASALATTFANGISVSKMDIASLCANSEHYIGTQGGGMDQAIAFLAAPGAAKLIEFNPLKETTVYLPSGASFVVANSCVEINKAATSHYNIRVVECCLAAKLLAKSNSLQWEKFKRLGDVQEAVGISLSQMPAIVKEVLHVNPYSRQELCNLLGVKEKQFQEMFLSEKTRELKEFKLYQRAMHVYQEADRVWQFKHICNENAPDALQKLGRLMNDSHASCKDLYECSHPDLDRLVEIAITAGALGSRLTGAGWGGCSVSLVPTIKVNDFLKEVKKQYYSVSPEKEKLMETSIFQTQPGGGAVIYKP